MALNYHKEGFLFVPGTGGLIQKATKDFKNLEEVHRERVEAMNCPLKGKPNAKAPREARTWRTETGEREKFIHLCRA